MCNCAWTDHIGVLYGIMAAGKARMTGGADFLHISAGRADLLARVTQTSKLRWGSLADSGVPANTSGGPNPLRWGGKEGF